MVLYIVCFVVDVVVVVFAFFIQINIFIWGMLALQNEIRHFNGEQNFVMYIQLKIKYIFQQHQIFSSIMWYF